MDSLTFMLLALAVAATAVVAVREYRRRKESAATLPPGWESRIPAEDAQDSAQIPAESKLAGKAFVKSTELGEFEWENPITVAAAASGVDAPAGALPTHGADLILRRKVRDRYIAARFPCTAQSSADLENIARVITAARLFFEEDQPDRALEFLELASEQSPGAESLDLAQLEIAFLTRDAGAYVSLAMAFRHNRPASNSWNEIARLGRVIAPQVATFLAPVGEQADARQGASPEIPNWIGASLDLSCEILGSEFHRAMKRRSKAFDAGPLHVAEAAP